MSASLAGRHVVGFEDLSIDVCLEVQNKRYSQKLYLIGHIAYGFIYEKQGNLPKTYFPTSWLRDQSVFWFLSMPFSLKAVA